MPRRRTKALLFRSFSLLPGAIRLALAGLFFAVLTACSPGEDRAVLHTAKGDFAFAIEIADTNAERAKGLMFRDHLAPDAGMLFDYHQEQQASFWMQNTLIPLDMIFIGADGIVKTIHVNARPMDTTGIPSKVPVRFVLEIPGGRSVEIGLAVGDRFEHPRVGTASSGS
jgi:uncharacterized membrane protein (UPF0127 family)